MADISSLCGLFWVILSARLAADRQLFVSRSNQFARLVRGRLPLAPVLRVAGRREERMQASGALRNQ